jgi:purine-cytosine permease-like protein
MLFLSLLFITLNLLTLFKGSLFYSTNYKIKEFTIKQYENKLTEEEIKDFGIKVLFSFLFALAWVVAQIIYYLNALFIDQLKMFTIIMIAVMITEFLVNTLKNNKSKIENDSDLEDFKKQMYSLKKHSFKQKVYALLCIAYFSYSFYVMVF